jgi:ribosomal protein S18 acetylase RimI-like enzyme
LSGRDTFYLMKFQRASLANLDEIASLFHSCWHISYRELLSEKVIKAMSLENARDLWRPALVEPRDKETVLGFAESDLVSVFRIGKDSLDETRGHLFSLYVAPSAAGRGYGRASLSEAMLRLTARGERKVSLWVFDKNSLAKSLYTSAGFIPTGASRVDDRWKEQEIEMLKVLK